jgi:hypothetical protein
MWPMMRAMARSTMSRSAIESQRATSSWNAPWAMSGSELLTREVDYRDIAHYDRTRHIRYCN